MMADQDKIVAGVADNAAAKPPVIALHNVGKVFRTADHADRSK